MYEEAYVLGYDIEGPGLYLLLRCPDAPLNYDEVQWCWIMQKYRAEALQYVLANEIKTMTVKNENS